MTATLTGTALDPFPLYPPGDWFTEKPSWLAPLQKSALVTSGPEAGRVAGYLAPWDQCLIDGTTDCWTVPPSPTQYENAHQGDTVTAGGETVKTANIGGGVNHARLAANFHEAVKHYHNTAAMVMRVRYAEDEHGIYALGALWPDVTESQVAITRAAGLSGDWRFLPHLGAYDLCGSQLVPVPGFPLIRKLGPRPASLEVVTDPLHQLPPVFIGGLGGVGALDPRDAAISEPLEIIREPAHDCGCSECATRGAVTASLEQRVADLEDEMARRFT